MSDAVPVTTTRSMAGKRARKRPSARGSRYTLIDALVPRRTRPATTPRSCWTCSTPACSSRKARAAWASRTSPAGVGKARLPTRSSSGSPSRRSSCATCMLTTGWVTFSPRASRENEPCSAQAQQAWLAVHGDAYPALVAAVGDEILGFGALAPYRPKPSYARTVEDSVYVKAGWRGKGVGGLILDALIEHARARDHNSMIARIIADNEASLRLHERHGFVRVGREREAALKLGRWLD